MPKKIFTLYNTYLRRTWVHRVLARMSDFVVDAYAIAKQFSFPKQYIRRWKLDMLEEIYEKNTTNLFKKNIQPGMTIVDVGAHIGYFTRIFSKYTGSLGHVYAFEPDPSNFALLKKNTRHQKNIKIFQCALSDHAGTIDFFHSDLKTGCHSTIPSSFRQTKLAVSATTLDAFSEKEHIDHIDIIKMDIEGGEIAALKGMSRTLLRNPKIQIVTEFNPECFEEAHIEPRSFLTQLTRHGFTIYAIRPSGSLEPIHDSQTKEEIMQGEKFVNIFCSKQEL